MCLKAHDSFFSPDNKKVNRMTCLREEREALEHIMIGPYGITADASKGRLVPEEEDEIRT